MPPLPPKDEIVDFSNFYKNQPQTQVPGQPPVQGTDNPVPMNAAITEEIPQKPQHLLIPLIILIALALIEVGLVLFGKPKTTVKPTPPPSGYRLVNPVGGFPYFEKIQK